MHTWFYQSLCIVICVVTICVCGCGICSTIWTQSIHMSFNIVMVADVLGNRLGDAGATALCPLLEHQPNLKNLNIGSKCIVWLRYVRIRVEMCGIDIFTFMHMCALHLVYTMCGVMSCLHMNVIMFSRLELTIHHCDWSFHCIWEYFCVFSLYSTYCQRTSQFLVFLSNFIDFVLS